jgi:hypothetical protein
MVTINFLESSVIAVDGHIAVDASAQVIVTITVDPIEVSILVAALVTAVSVTVKVGPLKVVVPETDVAIEDLTNTAALGNLESSVKSIALSNVIEDIYSLTVTAYIPFLVTLNITFDGSTEIS